MRQHAGSIGADETATGGRSNGDALSKGTASL